MQASDGEEGLTLRQWAGIRAAYLVISRHPSDMSREAYDLIFSRSAGFQPEEMLCPVDVLALGLRDAITDRELGMEDLR